MAKTWRQVLQFSDDAKPDFNEVQTRFRKLVRETTEADEQRQLEDAHEAARREFGAKPFDAPIR